MKASSQAGVILLCLLCSASPLAAQQPSDPSVKQDLVAVSRCMEFAGEPAGLRQWAETTGIERAPPDLEKAYLGSLNKTGELFGYASSAGQVAFASQDDGGCTVFIHHVDGDQLVSGIEGYLNDNHFGPVAPKVVERKESQYSITSRDYEITAQGRTWRMVVSTTSPSGAVRFDALVTIYGSPPKKVRYRPQPKSLPDSPALIEKS